MLEATRSHPGGTPVFTLVRRQGERGAVLMFSGDVRSTGGEPLPGGILDIWQASAEGRYSPGGAALRPDRRVDSRSAASSRGPTVTPPGSLDMASMRPAHIHVRLTHPGFATLTTQLFFAQDPHLHSDPAEAVRPGLVMELERRADPADLVARGLLRPYFACRFGFVLAAVG